MSNIKTKLRKITPPWMLYYYYLRAARKAVMPDLKRRTHDKVFGDSKIEKIKRNLTLSYHIVEKGLTMPEPRPGFGKAVILDLGNSIKQYHSLGLPLDVLEFSQSVSALKEYKEFHASINFKLPEEINELLDYVEKTFPSVSGIKQIHIKSDEYFKDINASFDKFCMSRYSVRNYTNEIVPVEILDSCIELAQKSPSFCNRQPTRVHIVKSEEKKKGILELQNGNRGFGYLAETLLVITSLISTTKDIHERNENHLNGGMFCMTLLNALHFHKIGACSLNWSVSDDKDRKLREILNIPENEVVLLVISCGYVPENLAIAASPRKTAKEITTLHS